MKRGDVIEFWSVENEALHEKAFFSSGHDIGSSEYRRLRPVLRRPERGQSPAASSYQGLSCRTGLEGLPARPVAFLFCVRANNRHFINFAFARALLHFIKNLRELIEIGQPSELGFYGVNAGIEAVKRPHPGYA